MVTRLRTEEIWLPHSPQWEQKMEAGEGPQRSSAENARDLRREFQFPVPCCISSLPESEMGTKTERRYLDTSWWGQLARPAYPSPCFTSASIISPSKSPQTSRPVGAPS